MQDFLFKMKNGSTLHFFYDKPNKLSLKKLLASGVWSKTITLLSDISSSYAIGCDAQEHFHIIYQNKSGSIFYALFDGETLKSYEVLKSRTNELYDRHFQILVSRRGLHCFYILKKDNLYSLIHHPLQSTEHSLPKILGNLSEKNLHFNILQDLQKNLHIFYQSSEETLSIAYKKFIFEKGIWVDSLPLRCSGSIQNFSCCITGTDDLCVCYQQQLSDGTAEIILAHLPPGASAFRAYSLLKIAKPYRKMELALLMDQPILCLWTDGFLWVNPIEKFKLLWESFKKINTAEYDACHFQSLYPYEEIQMENMPFRQGKGLHLPLYEKMNPDYLYKKMMEQEISELKNRYNHIEKMFREQVKETEKITLRLKYLENKR